MNPIRTLTPTGTAY